MCGRPLRISGALLLALVHAGCGASRPPGPPVGVERVLPWGAVSSNPDAPSGHANLQGRLETALDQMTTRTDALDPERPVPYRILAMSGGGSRGAFVAGFLKGWSASGTRPQFDVVTGISTGALIATAAFLGPAYDDQFLMYTRVSNRDIFRPGHTLHLLTKPSMHDTSPLRDLIRTVFTEDVLDAVAAEHEAGRRLFVGTTNLESGMFTIWDLGAIASSDRPDRVERYRDVLLAAASFPVMFPPVYVPVEIDGEVYSEAHVDGAIRSSIFARSFMLDVEDLREGVEARGGSLQTELYTLFSGQPASSTYDDVSPRFTSVAAHSVQAMLEGISLFSSDSLFGMAMITGTDFRASWIPSTIEISSSPLDFDPAEMQRLFDLGFEMAGSPRPFIFENDAPRDPAAALLELIDPEQGAEIDANALERAAGIR